MKTEVKIKESIGKSIRLKILYNIFFVSLYESWIDGQSDELKKIRGGHNDHTE
jgi:hypothetical protein